MKLFSIQNKIWAIKQVLDWVNPWSKVCFALLHIQWCWSDKRRTSIHPTPQVNSSAHTFQEMECIFQGTNGWKFSFVSQTKKGRYQGSKRQWSGMPIILSPDPPLAAIRLSKTPSWGPYRDNTDRFMMNSLSFIGILRSHLKRNVGLTIILNTWLTTWLGIDVLSLLRWS